LACILGLPSFLSRVVWVSLHAEIISSTLMWRMFRINALWTSLHKMGVWTHDLGYQRPPKHGVSAFSDC
jgi:hypothetical protein